MRRHQIPASKAAISRLGCAEQVCGQHTEVVYVSTSAARSLGMSTTDALKQSLWDLFELEGRPPCSCTWGVADLSHNGWAWSACCRVPEIADRLCWGLSASAHLQQYVSCYVLHSCLSIL